MLDTGSSLNIPSTPREDTFLWFVKVAFSAVHWTDIMSQLFVSIVYIIKHKRSPELPLKNKTNHHHLQNPLVLYSFNAWRTSSPPGLVYHDSQITYTLWGAGLEVQAWGTQRNWPYRVRGEMSCREWAAPHRTPQGTGPCSLVIRGPVRRRPGGTHVATPSRPNTASERFLNRRAQINAPEPCVPCFANTLPAEPQFLVSCQFFQLRLNLHKWNIFFCWDYPYSSGERMNSHWVGLGSHIMLPTPAQFLSSSKAVTASPP